MTYRGESDPTQEVRSPFFLADFANKNEFMTESIRASNIICAFRNKTERETRSDSIDEKLEMFVREGVSS